jgi:hypothetical protein
MERSPSIKTQLINEFMKKSNVDRLDLWRLIEKAQSLLYYNNVSNIKRYASISIDPRLPRKIGGLDVWRQAECELSYTTMMHLRLVIFYAKHMPEQLPTYVKNIRKRLNRFRTIREDKAKLKWYRPGPFEVNRKEYKELIYSLAGLFLMIDTKLSVEEVDFNTAAHETAEYIKANYHMWEPSIPAKEELVEFVREKYEKEDSFNKKDLFKSWLETVPLVMKPLAFVDEAMKVIDQDFRVLKVDRETFEVYHHLNAQKYRVTDSLSRIRGENITTESGDIASIGEVDRETIMTKYLSQIAEANYLEWVLTQSQQAASIMSIRPFTWHSEN